MSKHPHRGLCGLWQTVILLLCLTPPLGAQQDPGAGSTTLELMDLYHRSAEDLLPLLRPLLAPDEAASGRGDKLLLRIAPGRLSEVRELVERLDTPLRNLRVTLRLAGAAELQEQSLRAAGRIDRRGAQLDLGAWRASTDRTRNWQQQLRVLEGHEALLQVGRQLPRLEGLYLDPPGVGIDYYPLTFGLRVLPRVTGQRVTVEIAPHDRQLDPAGRIQTRQLHST
ncbi:MAG: hypothetical protein R3310_06640, partial [Candidatus Competibacteraceae bacterium]|nr:hypothetical protein [Candidatus Competibacteraceae bacterium]